MRLKREAQIRLSDLGSSRALVKLQQAHRFATLHGVNDIFAKPLALPKGKSTREARDVVLIAVLKCYLRRHAQRRVEALIRKRISPSEPRALEMEERQGDCCQNVHPLKI